VISGGTDTGWTDCVVLQRSDWGLLLVVGPKPPADDPAGQRRECADGPDRPEPGTVPSPDVVFAGIDSAAASSVATGSGVGASVATGEPLDRHRAVPPSVPPLEPRTADASAPATRNPVDARTCRLDACSTMHRGVAGYWYGQSRTGPSASARVETGTVEPEGRDLLSRGRTDVYEHAHENHARNDRNRRTAGRRTGAGPAIVTFAERDLSPALAAVREAHAPNALVRDADRDFETLPSARAEELGLLVDSLDPVSYPASWLPPDAPEVLVRYASAEFTIGAPGDGGVAWTRQTDPPVIFVKPRLEGSPDAFVDFLVAEALVQVGLDVPEQFLGFFEEHYSDLADAARDHLDPVETYQLAAALYDAYLGLHTRETFATWETDYPGLFDAWVDAGERLEPRLSRLSSDLATESTDFGDAAELACAAVKHGTEPPTPFSALDAPAYREYGADYAVQWAEKTFEKLD